MFIVFGIESQLIAEKIYNIVQNILEDMQLIKYRYKNIALLLYNLLLNEVFCILCW